LIGTDDEVAEALRGYAALGVAHVMVEFTPYTSAALERLASAVRRARPALAA
jgi:alkanesulfonate monooxygenase SsuD/methylene tetrahydromethanopterin reductase-like flavin-dependent oxidoreductase (luciferase family)